MREIDTEISNLVENMFPAFYKEDGENFILFVKAYYEWLEQNHQILTLENNTNFNVGDTVQQEGVSGTIVAFVGKDMLVHVDGLDTFKCFNVCSELLPITSSSGGSSFILKGGTTKCLGTLFLSRKLLEIRDIDKTLDLFIVRFKEKYLKNIEFDIQTNKQLLVKNSLDLYRSKGTQRSVDLFFRLIYGTSAEVYYPGDDVLRLSDGQWVRPQYLEISSSSVDRAITLVGKQVTGVTSGATAFVEKYIKRKIKDGFVHILYLSNVSGDFINRELLKSDAIYHDSPTVVGSLSAVEIISGSRLFNIGDIVTFNSVRGDRGLARVSGISNRTGVVDFILVDGGYGYTESANQSYSAAQLATRTQSIISEKVLTLSNVVTSNTVASIVVSAAGSGYTNGDIAVVNSPWSNATGRIATSGTGAITSVTLTNGGSGFYVDNPPVTITNSTGGATTGTLANLVATTAEQPYYFKYFEPVKQGIATVVYDSAVNNQLLVEGSSIVISNSTANIAVGLIMNNANGTLADANGTIVLGVNSTAFAPGNKIRLSSNVLITANIVSFTDQTANSSVMGVPNTATFNVGTLVGSIDRGDEVYQLDTNNTETGNATVTSTLLTTTSGSVDVADLRGVFRQGRTLRVRGKTTTANVVSQILTVGLYQISNNYTNAYSFPVYSVNTGTTANVLTVSAGSGASFRVGTISDAENIYLNTDLLRANNTPSAGANQAYMTIPLSAVEYGFPKNPTGNTSSVIFSCLNFDEFTIGTIASLTSINPGSDYNVDPYVLAYQPYITGFDLHDYIITVANTTGSFGPSERLEQTPASLTMYDLTVSSAVGYAVGEKVYQGTIGAETATGIIDSITLSTDTIRVRDVTGTFTAGGTVLKSYINGALAATTSAVVLATITSTAKAIIKAANSTVIYAKRIQFNNLFTVGSTVTGGASGASAKIVSVVEDKSVLPIGLNAAIEGNVITANGSVTSLQIIDSGIGYANGEIMLYTSEDGLRSGEAKAIVSGQGTGSGYYKTSKGFLSSLSKIHDGDYYQEYSYEILSRVPLEKYADMYKKVMHTAGTRFFGSVLLEDSAAVPIVVGGSAQSTRLYDSFTFNANTEVSNYAVLVNNVSNGALRFTDGAKLTYTTSAGNTAVSPLSNGSNYYVANATNTSIQVVTNPRPLSYTFNTNTSIHANNFIALTRHNLVVGDVVRYAVSAGNTAANGMSNGLYYHVATSNSSGVTLNYVNTSSGAANAVVVIPSAISENGHTLSITPINIATGNVGSNGHTFELAYEI